MVKKRRGQSASFMRSINPYLRSKKRGVTQVARRTRRSFRKARRSYGRSSTQSMSKTLIGAGIYGASRQKVATFVSPVTNMLPVGNLNDEVGLFALSWLISKKVKNPTIKSIANAGMVVEGARIGEALVNGGLSSITGSSSTSSSMTILG